MVTAHLSLAQRVHLANLRKLVHCSAAISRYVPAKMPRQVGASSRAQIAGLPKLARESLVQMGVDREAVSSVRDEKALQLLSVRFASGSRHTRTIDAQCKGL